MIALVMGHARSLTLSRPDLAAMHRDEGAALIAALARPPARRRAPQSGTTLVRQRAQRVVASPREGWPPVRGETLGL